MSLQAYHQAATRAESPRQTEYRLFAQVTMALMEAAKADPSDLGVRVDALGLEPSRLDRAERGLRQSQQRPAGLAARVDHLPVHMGRASHQCGHPRPRDRSSP